MRLLLLLLLSLIGCGRDRSPARDTTSPTEDLRAQYYLYHSLAPRDWAVSDKCDALLFASLLQVGLSEPGNIEFAQSEPGRWHRKPGPEFAASCSSDISRDMFTGLFVWIWEFRRLDLAEAIWEYGSSNNWKMGDERNFDEHFDRVYFRPGTVALLAELIYSMGGEDHWERQVLAVTPLSVEPGFQSHLSLLQLHLRGEMHDGLTEAELATLKQILTHMDGNPLAHALLHKYTDGDQSRATELLLSTWPSDRLPTGRNWSEEWRTQRSDDDSGLLPGDSDSPHSGGDFLFVSRIILGSSN